MPPAKRQAARGLYRRRAQQLLANHKQVHQSAAGKQPVGILLQSSVAHLHEPELQLHHGEHMLDLAAHARLVPVLGPLHFIHTIFVTTAPLGAIASSWRTPMNDFCLPLIRHPTPASPPRAATPAAPPRRPRWPLS